MAVVAVKPRARGVQVLVEVFRFFRLVYEDVGLRDRDAGEVVSASCTVTLCRPIDGKRQPVISELEQRGDDFFVRFDHRGQYLRRYFGPDSGPRHATHSYFRCPPLPQQTG